MKSRELVSKVVVPIAGLGTRMLPATKAIPKEMLPIVNKPIIQIIVEEIIEAGFKEVIFITHSSKSAVENHFDESFELESILEKRIKRGLLKEIKSISNLKIIIHSIRQGQAKGLGHAILCSKKIVKDEPFGIVLPDMVLNKTTNNNNLARLKKDFDSTGVSQILLGKTTKKEISNYGVVKINKSQIEKIIEKPSAYMAPSNLFAVGRYIFNKNLFKYLSNLKESRAGELELTDAIQRYIEDKQPIFYSQLEGKFYDCGNKLGYVKAIVDFALEDKSIARAFRSHIRKII